MVDEYEHKIKDIKLAEWGRKEIKIAEVEMPGLINLRKEFGEKKPLKGARISGSLHMTIQTAVLIETLVELGAEVRWCSCNIYSTQDQAAAAIVAAKTANVFAWKGENLEEYWQCTLDMLTWPGMTGPEMLVDDGGDATIMIHEGIKAEADFKKLGTLPDPKSTNNKELQIVLSIIRKNLEAGNTEMWTKMSETFMGLSEETTTGVHRLEQMARKGELLFKAINVNDSVTKQKFDNIYGCKHSLPDGLMRATDVMLAGKQAVICGFGDVGKGCAAAMKAQGSRVVVCEVDPICALQACMEGYTVKPLEDAVAEGDIFITTTGNKGIIMYEHMLKMKNNAIVGNIGPFDNEIDMATLEKSTTRQNIKPQCDRFVKPDGKGEKKVYILPKRPTLATSTTRSTWRPSRRAPP